MDAQKMGAFIAQCRKEKQMTQEQLAQRLQVTDKAVSRWENGETQPNTETLKLLSREFNVSIITTEPQKSHCASTPLAWRLFLLASPTSHETFSLSYRLLKNARFSHSMSPLGPRC